MAAKKSIDKRKVLEAAQKHWNKRNYDKALLEYQTLLEADPKDVNVRFKVGECFLRLGKQNEASAAYVKVAQDYTKQGFDAKAVAVYKQVLNLDAKNSDVQVALADLYQRLGLGSEAMGALQIAADVYNKEGKKDKALELLRKMASLDPTNTTSRLKVADLFRNAGRSEDALAEYEEVLNELERQGEIERVLSVGEQILALDSSRADLLARMAQMMKERREYEKAKELTKRACGADPRNVEYFEMLAELYATLGKDKEKQEAYKEVAKLYRERGNNERAQEILQKHVNMELGLDPNELSASGIDLNEISGSGLNVSVDPNELSGSGLKVDPFAPTDVGFGADPDNVLDFGSGGDLGSTLSDDEMFGDRNETSMSGALQYAPSETAAEETEVVLGDPEQVLAEASVYLRYNKHDKAVASLKALLKVEPEHRGALEMLGDAFVALGDKKEALQVWGKAATLAKTAGDSVVFDILKDRIAAVDAAFAASLNGVAPAAAATSRAAASAPATPPPVAADADFGFGSGDEFGGLDVSIDLDEATSAPGQQKDQDAMFAEESGRSDAGIEIELDVAPKAASPKAAPSIPSHEDELAFVEEPQIAMSKAKVSDDDTQGVAAKNDEDLEMANFYFEQEMYTEAKNLYDKVLKRSPGHPQALLRLGEIQEALGAGARAAAEIDIDVDIDVEATDATETIDAAASAPTPPVVESAPAPEFESSDFAPEIEISVDDDFAASIATASNVDTQVHFDSAPAPEPEFEPKAPAAAPPPPVVARAPEVAPKPPEIFEPPVAPPEQPAPSLTKSAPVFEEAVPVLSEPMPSFEEPTPSFVESAPAAVAEPSEKFESFEDFMAEEKPPEPEPEEEKFDLADALSDALSEDPNASSGSGVGDAGFEEVFKAFKKGVSETVSEGDYETHYDLGIAYKEMGLYEDALSEFKISLESVARQGASLHMLGLCSIELGRPENAVAYLGDALLLPRVEPTLQAALQYDMGRAFEAMHNAVGARACYEACAAIDPEFQDVSERLEDLNNPGASDEDTLSGIEPVQEAQGFESFDDLMSEPAEAVAEEAPTETMESFDDLMAEAEAEATEAAEEVIEAESVEEVFEAEVALEEEPALVEEECDEPVIAAPSPPVAATPKAKPSAESPPSAPPAAAKTVDKAAKKKKKISYI